MWNRGELSLGLLIHGHFNHVQLAEAAFFDPTLALRRPGVKR